MNRAAMPATLARERAGLTRAQAARLLGITAETLARLERRGGWSYGLAERARRLYVCSPLVFSKSQPMKKEAKRVFVVDRQPDNKEPRTSDTGYAANDFLETPGPKARR